MRILWLRGMVAALLLTSMLGCSAKQSGGGPGKAQGQGGGGAKVQSEGNTSVLDQELKRQGDIYRELLMHNAQKAQQVREADKKLLEGMRKQEQQARKRQVKELQRRQGLTGSGSDASSQGEEKDGQGGSPDK